MRAAARYLTASGAPRDMDRALFAYNRSDAYVRARDGSMETMKKIAAALRVTLDDLA